MCSTALGHSQRSSVQRRRRVTSLSNSRGPTNTAEGRARRPPSHFRQHGHQRQPRRTRRKVLIESRSPRKIACSRGDYTQHSTKSTHGSKDIPLPRALDLKNALLRCRLGCLLCRAAARLGSCSGGGLAGKACCRRWLSRVLLPLSSQRSLAAAGSRESQRPSRPAGPATRASGSQRSRTASGSQRQPPAAASNSGWAACPCTNELY